MYLAYIESGFESNLRELDATTEDEAKREAEILTTSIYGEGWKSDWKALALKIIVYKVEKEIEAFNRD